MHWVPKKEVEKEKTDARDRTAVDQNEIKALQADRAKVTGDMTPSALSLYERIRKSRAGIAVSEAVEGRAAPAAACHDAPPAFPGASSTPTASSPAKAATASFYYIPVQSVVDMSVPTPN